MSNLKVTKLVGVQADEYTSLSFDHNEFIEPEGARGQFTISIRDGGLEGGAHFFFHDIHEARTFATRVLEQIARYVD